MHAGLAEPIREQSLNVSCLPAEEDFLIIKESWREVMVLNNVLMCERVLIKLGFGPFMRSLHSISHHPLWQIENIKHHVHTSCSSSTLRPVVPFS